MKNKNLRTVIIIAIICIIALTTTNCILTFKENPKITQKIEYGDYRGILTGGVEYKYNGINVAQMIYEDFNYKLTTSIRRLDYKTVDYVTPETVDSIRCLRKEKAEAFLLSYKLMMLKNKQKHFSCFKPNDTTWIAYHKNTGSYILDTCMKSELAPYKPEVFNEIAPELEIDYYKDTIGHIQDTIFKESARRIGDTIVVKNVDLSTYKGIWFGKKYFVSCGIKFVHQLQNLYFALTGEELKIKPQ
jgi:hypothetical protein